MLPEGAQTPGLHSTLHAYHVFGHMDYWAKYLGRYILVSRECPLPGVLALAPIVETPGNRKAHDFKKQQPPYTFTTYFYITLSSKLKPDNRFDRDGMSP